VILVHEEPILSALLTSSTYPPGLSLNLDLPLLENKRLSLDPLPNVKDVFDNSLEVRGGIVGLRDKDVVVDAARGGCIEGRDGYEPGVSGIATMRTIV
jgi:hypothetical protein